MKFNSFDDLLANIKNDVNLSRRLHKFSVLRGEHLKEIGINFN